MRNSYYNTNQESGYTLKSSNVKANSQEESIIKIFTDNPKLSASEAWKIYDSEGVTPITSIRRAITNLCNEGLLMKTDDTKEGLYGKKEHIYKISKENSLNHIFGDVSGDLDIATDIKQHNLFNKNEV